MNAATPRWHRASRAAARAMGVAVLLMLTGAPSHAGFLEQLFVPDAKLWPRWAAHDAGARERIDHDAWDRLLDAHVSPGPEGVNRVAYGRVPEADRQALAAYLSHLQSVPISRYSRDEQLAYWINLYNALTMKVVLDHHPVDSIRDIAISPGLFSVGPFDAKLAEVEGERLSLNDIEHRILRPIWRDPRIHYGVHCAAIGCPNLQRTAFTGANVHALLDKGAREYVNSGRGAWFEDGALWVSSIYAWFEDDFAGTEAGVIEHLRRYAQGELAGRLAAATRIAGDRYDWSLNEAAAR